MSDFQARIKRMNKMFGVRAPSVPTMYTEYDSNISALGRLLRFKQIMQDELDEVDDIISLLTSGKEDSLDVLVPLADWLGDIQVYAASEMCRWGLPNDLVLTCILDAQDSKLMPDGTPWVENGKFQKGPNYVPPEPAIRKLLETLISVSNGASL